MFVRAFCAQSLQVDDHNYGGCRQIPLPVDDELRSNERMKSLIPRQYIIWHYIFVQVLVAELFDRYYLESALKKRMDFWKYYCVHFSCLYALTYVLILCSDDLTCYLSLTTLWFVYSFTTTIHFVYSA